MAITLDGTNGVTFPDTSLQTTTGKTGMVNRIINGAMVIDQRNAGAAVASSYFGYVVDRWNLSQSTTGKLTAQQNAGSVTPPIGFSNYLGATSQSAYSVGSGDYYTWNQPIEGFNTADFQWGTANAKTVTLSFWAYSSLTGTFGGSLQNSATTYSYPFTYSIPVANTWTQINITVICPTAGTWIGSTNGIGINLIIGLGVGSGYSGTAGSWASANYKSATGATSVVGTSGATFYITGVQLEKGSTATSFDYRPYGTELSLCQRYYERIVVAGGSVYGMGGANISGQCRTYIPFSTIKRSTPSFGSSAVGTFNVQTNNTNNSVSAISMAGGTFVQGAYVFPSTTITLGQVGALIDASSTSYLEFNSEL